MKKIALVFLLSMSVHSAEYISCNLKFGQHIENKDILVVLPNEVAQFTQIQIKNNLVKVKANYILGEENILLSFEFKTRRKTINKKVNFSRSNPLKVEQEKVIFSCIDSNTFDDVLTRTSKIFKLAKESPNSFYEKETLLFFAARAKNEKLVSYLLSLGADPLLPNKNGNIPLMALGNMEILKNLFKNSPNAIYLKNNIGWNALMFAAKNNNLDGLSFLIENGSKLNDQEKSGRTALMIASKLGHTQIVELLIRAGANLNLKRSNGMTAYMLASKYGHEDIMDLLKNAGASTQINLDLDPDFDWDLDSEEGLINY